MDIVLVLVRIIYAEECTCKCGHLTKGDEYRVVDLAQRLYKEAPKEEDYARKDKKGRYPELYV